MTVAWDTERTQRLLKEAAVAEFAEHGPAGTTMARIAARARINKERLYNYFGDKDALFETVLTEELAKLSSDVAEAGASYDDLGELAAATYDYHAAHPHLARLLVWEGLAGGAAAAEPERTERYAAKVAAVRAAQGDDAPDADHLMFMLIALAAWWIAVPQLARMLTGASEDDADEQARRRAFVAEAARRLAG